MSVLYVMSCEKLVWYCMLKNLYFDIFLEFVGFYLCM